MLGEQSETYSAEGAEQRGEKRPPARENGADSRDGTAARADGAARRQALPADRRGLLREAAAALGGERLEAELLLCHVLGCGRAQLLSHDAEAVPPAAAEAYLDLVRRRAGGEPLQYLLGSVNFMGLDLLVTPAVLIPRFDTERLAERAIALLEPVRAPAVLDACTGSGAIAIAISHARPDAVVWAGDLSAEALAVAEENNARCGTRVRFRQGDLLEPFRDLSGALDLLVSNPPYITTEEFRQLPRDVRREPSMALWGGADGLHFYRRLTEAAGQFLRPGGWLALEIGYRQGAAVRALMEERGLREITLLQDWQGLDRVLCGRKEAT